MKKIKAILRARYEAYVKKVQAKDRARLQKYWSDDTYGL